MARSPSKRDNHKNVKTVWVDLKIFSKTTVKLVRPLLVDYKSPRVSTAQ
jgi:hypothetical protein